MAAFKPRNVAIIAGVVCTSIFAFNKMGDFKTPGMQNIENRHSAAGGGHNHTPAGGSKMGSESDAEGKQVGEKGEFVFSCFGVWSGGWLWRECLM